MSLSVGSVRSLAFLAIPIMLSHLSSGMMLFIDRLFIAQIGTDYINSAMMTNMVYAFNPDFCELNQYCKFL